MSRPVVVWIAGAVAFAGSAGVAQATPSGPPPPPCSFTLSAPVRDGGEVAATVQSTGCAAAAVPYSTVACLQSVGTAQVCAQGRGADPARVSVPYLPGVSYAATGRGCAGWVGLPPAPNCQLLGPDDATP